MTKRRPFLSVIIPAHNEEKSIRLCIRALRNQNHNKAEIIVVNDGSTDNTRAIVRGERVGLINFDRGHSAAFARNVGANFSRGEYLVFIDADQIVSGGFIKKIAAFLSKYEPDGSDYLVFSYKPRTIFQLGWSAYRKCNPTMGFVHIVKRNVFMKLKFNEKIFYQEEADFKKRFGEKYNYYGPVNAVVYHIDPPDWSEFSRQRRWQGRMTRLDYFIPCIFPPIEIIIFLKVLLGSHDLVNSIYWTAIDLVGRYVSLLERIRRLRL